MQAESRLKSGGVKAYASKLHLKNEDAVVAAVMSAAGLPLTCVRTLNTDDRDYDFHDEYVIDKILTKVCVARVVRAGGVCKPVCRAGWESSLSVRGVAKSQPRSALIAPWETSVKGGSQRQTTFMGVDHAGVCFVNGALNPHERL